MKNQTITASDFEGFPKATITFLKQLKANNNRDWFAENKIRYESDVLTPALAFIAAMEAPMKKLSDCFNVIPKRMGGSLMRVYKDTRFAKDKTPFKTNIGIHFRHMAGKDVTLPVFTYISIPKRSSSVWASGDRIQRRAPRSVSIWMKILNSGRRCNDGKHFETNLNSAENR